MSTPDGPDGGREPQGQWSQDYAPSQAAIAQEPRNGIGTAALVVGILALISLVICWIPFVGIVCVVLGLIALILGIVGRGRVKRQQANNNGAAVTGIVLGALALVVGVVVQVIVIVLAVLFVNSGGGQAFQQLQQCVDQARQQPNPAAVTQGIQQCQQQFSQQLPGDGQ